MIAVTEVYETDIQRLEALLSGRLFLQPQLTSGRLYFISNLSGRLSLYVMDEEGGVPEPLLPPQLALQNPELVEGEESALRFSRSRTAAGADPSPTPLRFGVRDDTSEGAAVYNIIENALASSMHSPAADTKPAPPSAE